jgi:hypothetical protein
MVGYRDAKEICIVTDTPELENWTIERLLALIMDKTPEDFTLEFKASEALAKTNEKKKELAKDISALANSAGGTIIYGIVEDRSTHAADKLDAGTDQVEIPPEWIEQIVDSRVHPKINGLRVFAIPLRDSDQAKVAYIVEVPQGTTAHMASDNKYYKRRDRTVSAMEDYEVRDAMARDVVPRLDVEFEINRVTDNPLVVDVACFVKNHSITPAEWCVARCVVPSPLRIVNTGGASASDLGHSVTGWPVTILLFQYGGIQSMPVWQDIRVRLHPQPGSAIRIEATEPGTYPLGWSVSAPGMGWRNGEENIGF